MCYNPSLDRDNPLGVPTFVKLFYRRISQMRALLAAFRELVMNHNTLLEVLYVFEHKTWYISIHASYTRIVVFWLISNIPQ